jgi:7-carboxy-7-deazaguanine synthase
MRINSIFESISGEGGFFPQGSWVTFIRFQGCNLCCDYCDTLYARDSEGGEEKPIEEILASVKTNKVLITGGEPLLRTEDFTQLVVALLENKKSIQVETNGSYPPPTGVIGDLASRIQWVVDYKCPSSKMGHLMLDIHNFTDCWKTIPAMVKFVISPDFENMDFALNCMQNMILYGYKYDFLISPLNGSGQHIPKIVEFLVSKNCQELLNRIVFSVQLHKIVKLP